MSRFAIPLDTWENERGHYQLYAHLRDVASRFVNVSFTWDPPSCAANTTTETVLTSTTSIDFADLRTTHVCHVSPPSSLNAGLVCGGAYCATNGQLTIRIGNLTGGALNPASGTWRLFAFQV
jgi:hypothetical protein